MAVSQLVSILRVSYSKLLSGEFDDASIAIQHALNEYKDFEITDKYLAITERNIHNQPAYYLWSHKRFKHRNKVPKEWQ